MPVALQAMPDLVTNRVEIGCFLGNHFARVSWPKTASLHTDAKAAKAALLAFFVARLLDIGDLDKGDVGMVGHVVRHVKLVVRILFVSQGVGGHP